MGRSSGFVRSTWWAASACTLLLACSSASDASIATSDSDQDLTGQHIMVGTEKARQTSAGNVTDANRQVDSVHLGNADWLVKLSFLSYDNTTDIGNTLKTWGVGTLGVQYFTNTCNGAFAYYVSDPGVSILIFRGTLPNWSDIVADLESFRVGWDGPGTVHAGFLDRFNSLWYADAKCGIPEGIGQLMAARHTIDPTTHTQVGGQLYVTGHSMGAALATLALARTQVDVCAANLKCTTPPKIPISALYTFGSPKVGDQEFAYATADRSRARTPIYRFVNKDDIVTAIPRDLDVTEATFGSDYRHIGFSGDPEDIFQVWTSDQQMIISSFVFHVDDSVDDHLAYQIPIDYQAKARHEYH